jgi:peptidoglycan hydrolase-like protein with peptidoglycan-binding domain
MSHNRSHIFIRMAVATAIASMGLVALPGVASAATSASANASAKTAPGQPKFGEKGAHVVAIQTAIMRNGFTLKGGATGVFDNTTLKALKTFQKVVGLKVSGVVDADTARVLKVAEATTTTLAPTTTAAPTTTVAPTTTLPAVQYPFTAQNLPVRGNKGDKVLLVQKTLAAAGIAVKGGIDGMFGSGTTASISTFQAAKGLPVNGLLDATTAAALNLIAPITAPTTTVPVATVSAASVSNALTVLPVRGNKGDNVRVVQNALVAAGIAVKGGVDGIFGGATFVAIQKFQSAKGLAVTGKLDVQTAIKLGVMAAPAVQIAVFPVQGPCSFENTWHAPRGNGRQHLGVDIIAKEGNLLYAVADGTITKMYTVGTDKLAGNGVRLTMADGTYFFYGHMSRVADGITIGTKVKAGQVVGYNGKTGATNTPHLHFEVHPGGGEAIDPTNIVAAVDGCKNTAPLAVPAS